MKIFFIIFEINMVRCAKNSYIWSLLCVMCDRRQFLWCVCVCVCVCVVGGIVLQACKSEQVANFQTMSLHVSRCMVSSNSSEFSKHTYPGLHKRKPSWAVGWQYQRSKIPSYTTYKMGLIILINYLIHVHVSAATPSSGTIPLLF
jgi:hypothetical protein